MVRLSAKACSIEGCPDPHLARGWCNTHYRRWQRRGSPLPPAAPRGRLVARPPIDRVLDMLDVEPDDGCWVHRKPNRLGYGQVTVGSKTDGSRRNARAHTVAYEHFVGPVPPGKGLHHLCENPACANPAHLIPLTPEEHKRFHAAQITHCPQGHPYDEENTRIRPTGARACRACGRGRMRAMRAARRSA